LRVRDSRIPVNGARSLAHLVVTLAAFSTLSCTRMPTSPEPVVLVGGRILDPRGGAVPNVAVMFESVGASFGHATTADKAGRYRIPLELGEYDVYFAIADVVYPGGGRVLISPKTTTMDFTLEGVHVRGVVLDAAGDPGERLRVGVSQIVLSGWDSEVIDGAYSLFIPEGTYTFEVTGEDYQTIFSTSSIPVHADTTLDLRLDRFPVKGFVRGANGNADEGAYVTAGGVAVESDAAGRYALYPPPAGIQVRCLSHDRSVLGRVAGPFTITDPTTVDFDLRGTSWAGTVRHQNTNEAAVDCFVAASVGAGNERRSAVDRISDTGEFHLTLEPDLAYDFEVWGDESRVRLYQQTLVATADTTFQLYVPSVTNP